MLHHGRKEEAGRWSSLGTSTTASTEKPVAVVKMMTVTGYHNADNNADARAPMAGQVWTRCCGSWSVLCVESVTSTDMARPSVEKHFESRLVVPA